MVIAVDFDGTLCEHKFPEIGSPNFRVIRWVKKKKAEGHTIILHTCRNGDALEDAVIHAKAIWGLEFDYINKNIPEIEKADFAKDKICADIYLDDKALNVKDI